MSAVISRYDDLMTRGLYTDRLGGSTHCYRESRSTWLEYAMVEIESGPVVVRFGMRTFKEVSIRFNVGVGLATENFYDSRA